jgi:hypothetical protein
LVHFYELKLLVANLVKQQKKNGKFSGNSISNRFFFTRKEKYEVFEGLSNSKNMFFNVKKLLNVSVGLTLQQRWKAAM